MSSRTIIKLLFILYLGYISALLYDNPLTPTLISSVNLIFHEAGHALTILFGDFIHILGGSIFEIGIPALITLYFINGAEYFSAGFGAWWTSTAFYSVSVYAGDAVERALPLLGGDSVGHDWHNLLSMTSAQSYHNEIAGLFLILSLLALFYSVYNFYLDIAPTIRNAT